MTGDQRYREAGVDIAAADAGLAKIIAAIKGTWPAAGQLGGVALDIGYFANVIDIGGGIGLAICTDGVGSKSIIADMLKQYDTIGIDCVAMNVNDLICVGARPLSMVDYIAVGSADAEMLGAIAIGLAEGARQAGISISGGEIAQLKDVVTGFDLVGMAVGMVPLDRIIYRPRPGAGRRCNRHRQQRHPQQRADLGAPGVFRAGRVRPGPCVPGTRHAARAGIAAADADLCAGGARHPQRCADRQGIGQYHRRRIAQSAAGRRESRVRARQSAAAPGDLSADPAIRRS